MASPFAAASQGVLVNRTAPNKRQYQAAQVLAGKIPYNSQGGEGGYLYRRVLLKNFLRMIPLSFFETPKQYHGEPSQSYAEHSRRWVVSVLTRFPPTVRAKLLHLMDLYSRKAPTVSIPPIAESIPFISALSTGCTSDSRSRDDISLKRPAGDVPEGCPAKPMKVVRACDSACDDDDEANIIHDCAEDVEEWVLGSEGSANDAVEYFRPLLLRVYWRSSAAAYP